MPAGASRSLRRAAGSSVGSRRAPTSSRRSSASALEQGVVAAQVTVIGAVRRAAFAYYEQDDHRYPELSSETHHEIVGFTGNVSLRDDRPFLHAHATFADASGASVGGHLLRGCEVFAAEVMIRELGASTLGFLGLLTESTRRRGRRLCM